MASIDSGVDTGNDSNDSFAQDKNLTVQMEQPQSEVSQITILQIPVLQMENKDDSTRNDETENSDIKDEPHSSRSETMQFFSMDPPKIKRVNSAYSSASLRSPVDEMKSLQGSCLSSLLHWNQNGQMVDTDMSSSYQSTPLITKMRSLLPRESRFYLKKFTSIHMANRDSKKLFNGWLDFTVPRDENRLRIASFMNDVQKVEHLLLIGISPNCPDHQRRTPLHLAACNGYAEVVKLLLQFGADPNVRDMIGNTPLHLAVCTNHIDVVTLLLKAGTDATSNNKTGRSPLQLAQSKLRVIRRCRDSAYKHQVTSQVIDMLLTFIKRKRDSLETIDEDLLNSFQTRLQVSETQEQVENELQNLLDNLSSLSLANNNNNNNNNNNSSTETATQ